jgi:hypothetical protein
VSLDASAFPHAGRLRSVAHGPSLWRSLALRRRAERGRRPGLERRSRRSRTRDGWSGALGRRWDGWRGHRVGRRWDGWRGHRVGRGERRWNGGASATAGTTGKGGSAGEGGTGGTDVGGHAGSISLGGAPPETEQWTCDVKDSCGVTTVALNSCFVDTERPKSPDDCEPGEVFACIAVNLSLELSQAHLNCECIPVPPEPSLCPCPTVSEGSNPVPLDTTGEECSEGTHLCGCAVTCILK